MALARLAPEFKVQESHSRVAGSRLSLFPPVHQSLWEFLPEILDWWPALRMKPVLSLLSQRPAASAGFAALLFCVGVWVFVGSAPSSPRMRAVIGPPALGDAFADPEISLAPCAAMAEYIASAHPSLGGPGVDAAKKPKQPLLPGVVLVTGNAGFIGNHLTHRLLKEGYAVVGLDALHADDDVTAAVQLSRLACQGYSAVNRLLPRAYKSEIAPRRSCYVRGSLADPGLLERIVMSFGVTHIVHLAAQAGVRKSLTAPESYLYNNMEVRAFAMSFWKGDWAVDCAPTLPPTGHVLNP